MILGASKILRMPNVDVRKALAGLGGVLNGLVPQRIIRMAMLITYRPWKRARHGFTRTMISMHIVLTKTTEGLRRAQDSDQSSSRRKRCIISIPSIITRPNEKRDSTEQSDYRKGQEHAKPLRGCILLSKKKRLQANLSYSYVHTKSFNNFTQGKKRAKQYKRIYFDLDKK